MEIQTQAQRPRSPVEGVAATSPAELDRSLFAGRFRPVRLLGEGAMGQVFEAEDLLVGDRLAIKRLRRGCAPDAEAVERCRREVQAARRISHPNVCRVFDLVAGDPAAGDDEVYVTMELVRGETLAERLGRRGRLPPEEILPIARQLCAALEAAHQAGVVHRDLKPANVLLEARPGGERVVVTDFGLARCLAGTAATLTAPGDLVGSPAYVAPEQVRGERAGPAADLFALGVVLYELATGSLPFEGETGVETALARLHGPPPSPSRLAPGLDPRWDRAILKCLALDPARRFAGAGEVLAALRGDADARPKDGAWHLARPVLLALLLLAGGGAVDRRARAPEGVSPPAPERPGAASERVAGRETPTPPAPAIEEAARRLQAGELEGARGLYEDVLAAARERGDRETVVRALTGLGIVRSRGNDLAQAERLEREALRLARQLGDDTRVANLLNNLGVVVVRQGRLPEAEKLYREAAALYRAAGEAGRRAAALNNLGELLRRQGHLAEAETAHRESLALRRAVADRRGEAVTLLGLGRLAAARGDAPAARNRFAEALATFRREGHPDGAAEALVAMAEAARAAGDGPGARQALHEALALSRRHDLHRWEAEVSRVRALDALGRGEPEEAVRRARDSLIAFEELFDGEGRARAGVVLARALVAQGGSAEAAELLARLRERDWVRQDRALRLAAATAAALADGALGADPRRVEERLAAAVREAASYGLLDAERAARRELAAFERARRASPDLEAPRLAVLEVKP